MSFEGSRRESGAAKEQVTNQVDKAYNGLEEETPDRVSLAIR